MIDNVAAMAVFAHVVEAGGFSAAALRLGISKSAVSKRIAALEVRLGARLLNRTTRRINLTEAGARLFERSRRILAEADAAEREAGTHQVSPSGLLRVSVGVSFGQTHLAPVLPEFLAGYPDLSAELMLNDRAVDLVEEGYDVALRVGELADSAMIARRLSPVQMLTAASPAYLDDVGTPMEPRDLAGSCCLGYSHLVGGTVWRFTGPGGPQQYRFKPRLIANNGDALAAAASAGLGVVHLPDFILSRCVANGVLVEILSDFRPPPIGLYAVYPPGRPLPAKVRAFVDFVALRYSADPPWV